jgi:hypothetical protein
VRDGLATACLARVNAPDPDTYQADARFAFKPINEIVTADVLEILQPLWARVPETVERLAVGSKAFWRRPKRRI